jgi:hypothetical protein
MEKVTISTYGLSSEAPYGEIKVRDCEIPDEYVLKSDVVEAIEKLKERYPNFIPAIDETFESVIC